MIMAKVTGLREAMYNIAEDLKTVIPDAMGKTVEKCVGDLQAQVVESGLGERLSRTWRGRVYENKGIDAAGWIFTKAPQIIAAFDEGMVIVAKNHKYMAIPMPWVPRAGVGGHKKMTPMQVENYFHRALDMVFGKKGIYLILPPMGSTGDKKYDRKFRKGLIEKGIITVQANKPVVMFILVKQVKDPKLLDLQSVVDKAVDFLEKEINDQAAS